jgi:hypothetical protein
MSTAVGSCSSRSRTTVSFWLAQKLQGMCGGGGGSGSGGGGGGGGGGGER